ncbi:MAG: hypothetical protein ACK42L_00005 [Thermoanaerobaculum sp.]
MRKIWKKFLLGLFWGCSLPGGAYAHCWDVPVALFHPAKLPGQVQGKNFTFSGNGPILAFFLREKDGRTRMLRLKKERVEEFFLAPPAGQSFRSPRWTLWDGGEVAVVDDERFFAVYLGASLAFYEEKRHRGELWPAFRNGEVFWSPHEFDLCRERKNDVVRGAYLSTGGEHEVWSVGNVNWEAPLPEKIDRLAAGRAFAVPSRKGVWLVEPFGGNVYFMRGGEARQVLSAKEQQWTKWSAGEAKEDIAKKVEEIKETKLAEAEAMLLGDATRRERKKMVPEVKLWEPYFRRGFARDDELFLQLDVAKPEKSLLWFPDTGTPVCLSFKLIFEKSATWQEDLQGWYDGVTVTEEAVWFKKPFGFVLLDDLTQWLANQSQQAPTTEKD